MKQKIKADPYGNDQQFNAYIRQGKLKQILVIVAIVILVVLSVLIM